MAAIGTVAVAPLLDHASLGAILLAASSALVMLVIERGLFRSWVTGRRRRGELVRRVVLVGADDEAAALKQSLEEHPETGVLICGFVAPRSQAHRRAQLGVPWLGSVSRVPEILQWTRATGVVIVSGAVPFDEVEPLVRELPSAGFHVHVSSGLHGIASHRLRALPLAYEPLLYVEPVALREWQARVKRVVDVVVSTVSLLLVAPLLLLAAVAIKLEDKGPVLFRQPRVGLEGRPFRILKLRTMTVDADARRAELAHQNQRGDGPLFKLAQDPRVTRCGRLLRRTSIDELPQLINVLRGEMSLVGPRPALVEENESFDARLQRRVQVRPGITGLWQVEARDNPAFGPYRRLDLHYVENWSVSLDLSILTATAFVVLARAVSLLPSATPSDMSPSQPAPVLD